MLLAAALAASAGAGTLPRSDTDRAHGVLSTIAGDCTAGPWTPLVSRGPGAASAETVLVSAISRPPEPAGFAVLSHVRGKDQPITLLVVTDTSLAVTAVEIVTYRESYGGEVRRSVWRRQFRGLRPGDPMRHGREILNITGATISARAVTDGVRNALSILQASRNRLPAVPREGP